MSLESLISTYGYAAIGGGTFLEGETILILGGFAAHRGFLSLPWVIVAAFMGTLLGDQAYFYIGRLRGAGMLERRPLWKAKSEKVFSMMRRHQTLLILTFRFLYGLRTVTPFLVGAGGISPRRFLILNALSAAVWAAVFGCLGYLFGQTMEWVLGNLKKYEMMVFGVLTGIGLFVWMWKVYRDRAG